MTALLLTAHLDAVALSFTYMLSLISTFDCTPPWSLIPIGRGGGKETTLFQWDGDVVPDNACGVGARKSPNTIYKMHDVFVPPI